MYTHHLSTYPCCCLNRFNMSGSGIFTIVKELTCFIQTAAFLYEVFCYKNTD